MASRYEMSESQWERIEDCLPGRKEHVGCTAENHRKFVNGFCGCCAAKHAGAACRSTSASTRARTGDSCAGLIRGKRIFHELVRTRENQYLMIDSTLVRAHQEAATGRKEGTQTRLWGVPEVVERSRSTCRPANWGCRCHSRSLPGSWQTAPKLSRCSGSPQRRLSSPIRDTIPTPWPSISRPQAPKQSFCREAIPESSAGMMNTSVESRTRSNAVPANSSNFSASPDATRNHKPDFTPWSHWPPHGSSSSYMSIRRCRRNCNLGSANIDTAYDFHTSPKDSDAGET